MISNLIKIGFYFVLCTILFNACLKDDTLNQPFTSFVPIDISDGLILSNPSVENIDPDALTEIYQDVYNDDDLWSLRSLLVFRNGKLISEAYMKSKEDITEKHLIWSCTKQVIGILTGIAIEEGLIKDLEDPMSDYFDSELTNHQDKSNISIRNLITMRSGIDYNNDGAGGETDKMLRQIPENSIEFILDRPINAEQGTEFHYNDGNPHLMSALIQKIAGKATDEWADEVLFSKLEMINYNWVRYKDGVTLGGYGIESTPRELAKIALCVSNQGMYKGQQIVSSTWIEEMTSKQVEIEDSDYSFGYYWWIDSSRDIHFMWGHGGQFAFVIPSKNAVVVMTSIPNTQGDYQIDADEALSVVDRIIEACRG